MKYLLNGLFLCLLSLNTFAAPAISYEGFSTHAIPTTPSNGASLRKAATKQVTLLKIKLSNSLKKKIQVNASHALLASAPGSKYLPSSVQLGMNHVPVLDQGNHGTCATFALLGALDALRGEGDYYSELCSLNLGKKLAEHGYSDSGWEGQDLIALLARVDEFGLVSKNNQRANGCGGITEYPQFEADTSDAMSLRAFHAISEPGYFSGMDEWSTIFDMTQWASKNTSMNAILERTKTSLYYGNRLVIGALLPITDDQVGLLGTHHVERDSLVLTPRLEQAIQLFLLDWSNWGGHALIITGYDDDAVAIDNEGRSHKGLFTLRNSWGSDIGDHGDIYMSYDYFKALAIELIELFKVSP